MTWALASGILLLAAPFVLWPLIRHLPPDEAGDTIDAGARRRRELEDLELDVALGRLSAEEAARRRRELRA